MIPRLACAWLALLYLLPGITAAADQGQLLIGTGPVSSFTFPLGGELCRLYEGGVTKDARCYVAPTGGSADAIDRLRSGELTMAIVQSDQAADALAAHGAFSRRPPFPELRSVTGFFADALTILIRADGPIRHVDDLKGKRVAVGEPGAPDPLFSDLLDALGWTKADLAGTAEMPHAEQIAALCGGKIAALALTAPHPNGFVRQAMATCPATVLDLAGAGIDSILALHHAYGPTRIDLSLYGGPAPVVQSFGPRAVLVATAKTDDQIVRELLGAVFRHVDQLRKAHPAFAALDTTVLASAAGIGVERHPAAIKYFSDNNIRTTASSE
jgi:TRAP transporter TAXI family solute receptor